MALPVIVKPHAQRQIEQAAEWWSRNRPAARGAIRLDLTGALAVLAEHSGIGTKVETARKIEIHRLYRARVRYFVYYRTTDSQLEVIAFWHASRAFGPAL